MKVLRRVVFILASLVFGWHGMGAPLELAGPASACNEDSDEHMSDAAGETLGYQDDSRETCPPGCEDDCPCCGTAVMAVSARGLCIHPPLRSPVGPRVDDPHGTPTGEHDGVYRPPRA